MDREEAQEILDRDKNTGVLRIPNGGEAQIRQGKFVTLSEAFWFGKDICSCYDIYGWYLSLPVWISKRVHSASANDAGMERRVAKVKRRQETGSWALPAPPWERRRRQRRRRR